MNKPCYTFSKHNHKFIWIYTQRVEKVFGWW
jgi:hypothetical protein